MTERRAGTGTCPWGGAAAAGAPALVLLSISFLLMASAAAIRIPSATYDLVASDVSRGAWVERTLELSVESESAEQSSHLVRLEPVPRTANQLKVHVGGREEVSMRNASLVPGWVQVRVVLGPMERKSIRLWTNSTPERYEREPLPFDVLVDGEPYRRELSFTFRNMVWTGLFAKRHGSCADEEVYRRCQWMTTLPVSNATHGLWWTRLRPEASVEKRASPTHAVQGGNVTVTVTVRGLRDGLDDGLLTDSYDPEYFDLSDPGDFERASASGRPSLERRVAVPASSVLESSYVLALRRAPALRALALPAARLRFDGFDRYNVSDPVPLNVSLPATAVKWAWLDLSVEGEGSGGAELVLLEDLAGATRFRGLTVEEAIATRLEELDGDCSPFAYDEALGALRGQACRVEDVRPEGDALMTVLSTTFATNRTLMNRSGDTGFVIHVPSFDPELANLTVRLPPDVYFERPRGPNYTLTGGDASLIPDGAYREVCGDGHCVGSEPHNSSCCMDCDCPRGYICDRDARAGGLCVPFTCSSTRPPDWFFYDNATDILDRTCTKELDRYRAAVTVLYFAFFLGLAVVAVLHATGTLEAIEDRVESSFLRRWVR